LLQRKGPRIFQSVIAAVGDLYLYKLSYRLFGERAAQWTVSSVLIGLELKIFDKLFLSHPGNFSASYVAPCSEIKSVFER